MAIELFLIGTGSKCKTVSLFMKMLFDFAPLITEVNLIVANLDKRHGQIAGWEARVVFKTT